MSRVTEEPKNAPEQGPQQGPQQGQVSPGALGPLPAPQLADDPIEAGRLALGRHAWAEAFESLAEVDQAGLLTADGLRMLAESSWWSGNPESTIDAMERAYRAYLKEENKNEAAMMAFQLALQHLGRLAVPLATAWTSKAERLAADEPESLVNAHLAWMHGFMNLIMGNRQGALSFLDRSLEAATRLGDPSLQALSLHHKGVALYFEGSIAEGMALIDESMVAVVGGELDPFSAGQVYCSMINVCSQSGDFRRSAEWTEALNRWCESQSIAGFPGMCRLHRAELMRIHGMWPPAEEQARLACDELPRYGFMFALGYGFYEIGEIRRRMGDFAGAEEAYNQAHEVGMDPQPGLALIRLAQGKLDAAAAGVRQALGDDSKDRLSRARPLMAQAEIAIAAGDLETAAEAADELESIADDYDTSTLHSFVDKVRALLSLAAGEGQAALSRLRRALKHWQELDAPFEAAETRVLIAKAHRAIGDNEAALLEAKAARTIFERLGARSDAEQVGELVGDLSASGGKPERVRRAFMFTDIARSTDLVGVIGDEAWESLLTWHDQTLHSLFASHGGDVAHHTGDGFFVAFEDPSAAIKCAVAVQRALAEHRRSHGFAPLVRIGVHLAEATRRGRDYGGGEVHKASRIADQALGSEILVSEETLAETDLEVKLSEPRELSLKGIPDPVRVATVEWR